MVMVVVVVVVQWNLRIVDTLGTQHFVLCREVLLLSEVILYGV